MKLHHEGEGDKEEGREGTHDTSPPTVRMKIVDLAIQMAEAVRDRLYEPKVVIVLDESMKPATAIVIMPVTA
jgi:hypothetical protein